MIELLSEPATWMAFATLSLLEIVLGIDNIIFLSILVGTYSSIYVASAIALDCGLNADHLLPSAIKHPVDDLP